VVRRIGREESFCAVVLGAHEACGHVLSHAAAVLAQLNLQQLHQCQVACSDGWRVRESVITRMHMERL
jgi:hypothetical protein